ncbi:MAG: 4'-phosphopantetheinyl transferase superfamily protein [Paludibacteraceae bacterium]|nr:4'-phosphopantetheinyl transferase superfamily protein [Paludibacteraceae bacterium]
MRIKIFDHMDQCTEAEVQRMLPLVSAQRREQALRYKHTFGRFCCLRSWLMLQELIGPFADWTYNEHGKPFIEGGPYFSISHCKNGIAVAVNDEPIGIDIEHIRKADESLIERTMNAEESQRLMANSQELRDRDFTRLWTQKEAVVKWQGTGIQSFEQLQTILSDLRDHEITSPRVETFEKENYIYSIKYGELHCFGA